MPKPPFEPVDESKAREIVAEFLVQRPLYAPTRFQLTGPVSATEQFYPQVIRRRCAGCRVDTNWVTRQRGSPATHENGHLLSFRCIQCSGRIFAVWVAQGCLDKTEYASAGGGTVATGSQFELRKLGQWEPWSIEPDAALLAVMSEEDADLYKKGLTNASQGYGLGALVYFRRVVENETDRLLAALERVAKEDGDDATLAALADAMKTRSADERLRLAAEATPAWLRVGGMNPLKAMYDNFSVGIHRLGDDECVGVALKLRTAFEIVFRTIRTHEEERKNLARVLNS